MGFWRAFVCCTPTAVSPADQEERETEKQHNTEDAVIVEDTAIVGYVIEPECITENTIDSHGVQVEYTHVTANEIIGKINNMEKSDAFSEIISDIDQILHKPAGLNEYADSGCSEPVISDLDMSDECAETPVIYNGFFLPPKQDNKPTLVLDLDHTLVYPVNTKPSVPCFEVVINYKDRSQSIWVVERPFLQEFLDELHSKFEIIIFTAGIRQYGTKVLKHIDRKGRVVGLLDRRHCSALEKSDKDSVVYVKNLNYLGRDLARTIIIDDREYSYIMNFSNGQDIPAFNGDPNDRALPRLQEYLIGCLELSNFADRKFLKYHEQTE